jgi:hypothetical protein
MDIEAYRKQRRIIATVYDAARAVLDQADMIGSMRMEGAERVRAYHRKLAERECERAV